MKYLDLIGNIDIETIPSGNLEDFEIDKEAPKNLKDPKKIEAWYAENKEKLFRDQGKSPVDCKIIMIGLILETSEELKDDEPNPDNIYRIYGDDEKANIQKLEEVILKRLQDSFEEGEEIREINGDLYWLGFNIRKFDLEAIWIKAIKYECYKLAKLISRTRFDKNVLDVAEIFQGPRTMDFIKFDKVLKTLGVGQKTEGMDGSKVFDAYLEGKLESHIVPYCVDDIISNRKAYKKMQGGLK